MIFLECKYSNAIASSATTNLTQAQEQVSSNQQTTKRGGRGRHLNLNSSSGPQFTPFSPNYIPAQQPNQQFQPQMQQGAQINTQIQFTNFTQPNQ